MLVKSMLVTSIRKTKTLLIIYTPIPPYQRREVAIAERKTDQQPSTVQHLGDNDKLTRVQLSMYIARLRTCGRPFQHHPCLQNPMCLTDEQASLYIASLYIDLDGSHYS